MENLINEYKNVCEEEKTIKELKAELRDKIINFLGSKEEGTISKELCNHKITCQFKLNRKLDIDAYNALDLPKNVQFVDYKPTINLKKMRAVEMVDPQIVQSCVTVEPATPSLKITEK